MRKYLLACVLLLLLDASLARAAGVNLRWNDCYGGGSGGAQNNAFACLSNDGTHTLVGSFNLDANITQVRRCDAVVDLASASGTLPAWWAFKNSGTCGVLAANGVFGAYTGCEDWSAGTASGALTSYATGARGPNTARLLVSVSVDPVDLQELVSGQEYFSFNVTLNNVGTTGAGACAGCVTPVCIVLNSLQVVRQDGSIGRTLTLPGNSTDSNYVTWQGGGVPIVGSASGCPAATPVRNASWGAVKRMYR